MWTCKAYSLRKFVNSYHIYLTLLYIILFRSHFFLYFCYGFYRSGVTCSHVMFSSKRSRLYFFRHVHNLLIVNVLMNRRHQTRKLIILKTSLLCVQCKRTRRCFVWWVEIFSCRRDWAVSGILVWPIYSRYVLFRHWIGFMFNLFE